jgi:SH3-like domain-containing protein
MSSMVIKQYIKELLLMRLTHTIAAVVFSFLLISPVYSHALCVKGSLVNIRSGPGTNYKSVWQVYRYMPLKKVGVSLSGVWYAVMDVDGDVNWIHKSLLTGAYRCAVVKSESVNVRRGPGMHYRKKYPEPMRQYDSFRVLRMKGAWVEVKDDMDNSGWINKHRLWIN